MLICSSARLSDGAHRSVSLVKGAVVIKRESYAFSIVVYLCTVVKVVKVVKRAGTQKCSVPVLANWAKYTPFWPAAWSEDATWTIAAGLTATFQLRFRLKQFILDRECMT